MADEAHAEEAAKELNVVLDEGNEQEVPSPEVAPEVEAVPEVSETDTLRQEIEAMKAKQAETDTLYQDLKDQSAYPEQRGLNDLIDNEQAATVIPTEELDFGDIYADPEGYQKNMKDYLRNHDKAVTDQAVKAVMSDPSMQALQVSHWNREAEIQIGKADKAYGDRFAYNEKHVSMQQKLPGLAIEDSHRIEDYDRLLEEHKALVEGNKERANVAPTGSASPTRLVANTDEGKITVKLSSGEKLAADKYMGGDYQKYAAAKHRQATGGEI